MPEATTRRAVLGQLAAFPVVGGAGALIVCPATANAATLAKIDAAAQRCVEAKRTFEAALAAYTASAPSPHWSINYEARDKALCRYWAYNKLRFPGGPLYLPNDETLDDDFAEFCKANPHDLEGCRGYLSLKRRLMARVKRYKERVAAHIECHRLDDLQADCSEADQEMHELAKEVFERPATTMDEALLQARMLSAFGSSLGEKNDWPTYQAGLFGRQLADSLCKLDLAA